MSPAKGKDVSTPTPGELLKMVKEYYPSHPDLMMDLSIGAIWEYHVRSPTLDGNERVLFHLKKTSERRLELGIGAASETPDLILYFTEEAIVELMSSSPDAKTYYSNYSKIMKEGSGAWDLDYKVNKSRLALWRVGYRNWANRYGFMEQISSPDAK
ncbi:MAG: hypothetical protein WED04_04025 [Promethearchaeati archaeon SRVP18_Atabeyarchaeia-1]